MGDPKPLASLSSTLLARKGQAKPAMRPQGFNGFGFSQPTAVQDDLGWNDMGFDRPAAEPATADIVPFHAEVPSEAPVAPPHVVRQQEELVREMTPSDVGAVASIEPGTARTPRAAAGSKGRAAFTLRLDPERHLRLRLACAVAHRSAQAIVMGALDAFLDTQPAVAELERTARARITQR